MFKLTLLRSLLLLVLLAVIACAPARRGGGGGVDDDDVTGDDDDATGDDDDVTGDDDDDDDAFCPGILATWPEPAEDDYYGDTVSITWDGVPQSGGVAVATAAGVALSGSMSDDDNGRTLIFTADQLFDSDTDFTVTISWACADDVPYQFSTGPYGSSVSNESDLIDRPFHMDLASATFIEPPGVGPLLQGFLVDSYFLFNATADSDLPNGEMHVLGAVGVLDGGDIEQDFGAETMPFTHGPDEIVGTADDVPASWQNPTMDLSGGELAMDIDGVATVIEDFAMSATFHPQLTSYVGGTFAGTIDTRSLIGLLDSTDPNAMCDLLVKTVGVGCTDCGNGEVFCLDLAAEDMSGQWLSNIPFGIVPN